jgi:hypothetical protein
MVKRPSHGPTVASPFYPSRPLHEILIRELVAPTVNPEFQKIWRKVSPSNRRSIAKLAGICTGCTLTYGPDSLVFVTDGIERFSTDEEHSTVLGLHRNDGPHHTTFYTLATLQNVEGEDRMLSVREEIRQRLNNLSIGNGKALHEYLEKLAWDETDSQGGRANG